MGENVTTITINKWDDYQPRKDRASYTWLRLDHDVVFSEALDGLTADQKWFWVCLLCYASRKKSDTFGYNKSYFAKHFGLTESKMDASLKSFASTGLVTVSVENLQTPADTCSPATNERTDVTNETNERDGISPQDLVKIWNDNRGPLSEARSLSPMRIKHARAQLEKYPDLDHWLGVIKKFRESDFCLKKWQPGFDDFLSEEKRLRTLEGKYDNKTTLTVVSEDDMLRGLNDPA